MFLFVVARELIVTLFTTTYAASVPIFMVWSLTILPSIFAVDAVLRVFAQTRFLLVMNLMRLAIVAALIGWFLSAFGLSGAVLVTLARTDRWSTCVGVARIARLLHVSLRRRAAVVRGSAGILPFAPRDRRRARSLWLDARQLSLAADCRRSGAPSGAALRHRRISA